MKVLAYMLPQAEQTHVTEEYVSSPPALIIVDARGGVWTLGMSFGPAPKGEFAFPVLLNSIFAGVYASRIEMKAGEVRAFTHSGWKRWSGKQFI